MSANNNADWIEWKGGERPVPANAKVSFRFKCGTEINGLTAGDWSWGATAGKHDYGIIAYKVEKPEAEPAPAKFDHKEYLAAENERLLEASKIEATARLRDEFAMAALTALVRNEPLSPDKGLAEDAYMLADAMLAAREVKA